MCGTNKGNAGVFDMRMGRMLMSSIALHDGTVRSIVACPDGEHVASAGADASVRVSLEREYVVVCVEG